MFKYELEEYKPFQNINNYYILKDCEKDIKYFLFSKNELKYSLEIKNNGYIPKSGLVFDDIIQQNVMNKSVLDLGTGELGFLALHSLFNGAKKVTAVDIDETCIEWLNYLIKNNAISNVETKISDYYSEIDNNALFDIILSNPPQMPMNSENLHDSGGLDGRKYILKILKESKKHFNNNSKLFMLIFDFLGIDICTNNNESIVDIAKKYGYNNIKIVKKIRKSIKKDGVTYRNLEYINNVYPNYTFKMDENGELYCNMCIVLFE